MHTLTQFFVSSDTLQLRAIKLSVWHGLLGVVSQSCAGCFPWFVSRRCKGPLLSFLTQTHGISWAEHMMHVDISADPGTAGENAKTGLNLAELPTEATTATATAAATTTTTATTATTATTTTTTTTTTTATTTTRTRTRTRYKQQGTNNHWDPVLTIYLFLFLPLRVQTNTGTPSLLFSPPKQQQPHIPFISLLLDPFLCRERAGSSKKGAAATSSAQTFTFSRCSGWILQKGAQRHISSDLHLFPGAGPLFQPWAAEILQKGAPQPDLKVASISTFSLASLDTEAVPVSALSVPGCLLVAVAFCACDPVWIYRFSSKSCRSIPCMPGTSSSVGRVQGP